ncbi:hypothetical protein [Candidatus Nitrospira bockiana]
MTKYILNSAVLAAGAYGTYRYEPCSREQLRIMLHRDCTFCIGTGWCDGGMCQAPSRVESVVSRIGYRETADVIEAWTGWAPPISREPSVLAVGDVAYVVRLRYRVDPSRKGQPVAPSEADWEIAILERLT